MSNTPPTLNPGDIQHLHHTAVPYYSSRAANPRRRPVLFQRLLQFWNNLGMRTDILFAEESPDRGEPGWRLYVGSVCDPVQVLYRPISPDVITSLPLILRNVHICFKVSPEALQRLREHPAREREATWGPHHGLSSVLIAGPLGEEIEFTCPSPVDPD